MKINVIEINRYAPLPYVFSEAARFLRDSIRLAGFASDHLVHCVEPGVLSIVLGGHPDETLLHGIPADELIVFNFEQLGSNSALVMKCQFSRWRATSTQPGTPSAKRAT